MCILSNLENYLLSETRQSTKNPLMLIHTDTVGPILFKSYLGNNGYIITFTDDYLRLTKTYAIKLDNQAENYSEKF